MDGLEFHVVFLLESCVDSFPTILFTCGKSGFNFWEKLKSIMKIIIMLVIKSIVRIILIVHPIREFVIQDGLY